MANNKDLLENLIDCAEDGLKTIHRAASAKGASWSPEDRKAFKDWSEALSSLTTVKAMRDAENNGDFGAYAFGTPDYYRHGYYDTGWAGNWSGDGMGRNRGVRSTAYGIGMGADSDESRRRVIADLSRMRDNAPDERTRAAYARILSHEYGIT